MSAFAFDAFDVKAIQKCCETTTILTRLLWTWTELVYRCVDSDQEIQDEKERGEREEREPLIYTRRENRDLL
jgi:hypothetical protein